MLNTKKLNELMEAGNWNARTLAAAAALPHSTVWRAVRGSTSPTLETLTKLCVPLEINPSELIDANENAPKKSK